MCKKVDVKPRVRACSSYLWIIRNHCEVYTVLQTTRSQSI